MLVIGNSDKGYILWKVETSKVEINPGVYSISTVYNRIRKIANDEATAIRKYPNVRISNTLTTNRRNFTISYRVFEDVDIFRFGKYTGTRISECNDINYIAWYWGTNIKSNHKRFIETILLEEGYEIRTNNDGIEYLMSPESLQKEIKDIAATEKVMNKINNDIALEFDPDSNISSDGTYVIGNIVYKFNKYRSNYYQGYSYYLPVNEKGQAKRIKNKTVCIKKYSYTYENNILTINIEDFSVEK